MEVCNILLRKSNTGSLKNKQMQHHEENVFFIKIMTICLSTLTETRQYNLINGMVRWRIIKWIICQLTISWRCVPYSTTHWVSIEVVLADAQLLKPSPNYVSALQVFWKHCGNIMSNFSFCHSAFYPLGELSAFFIKWKYCRLQALSVWKSLKFVIWERVKDYTACNSSHITNKQVCANHNSVMLKGFLHGMFVFLQFLFMIQTYPVSLLGRATAIFTHFFQRSHIFFFQTNVRHSRIKIEWRTSAFWGKTFTFFKIWQKFIQATHFLFKSHTCTLLSTQANLQFKRVTSLYKYDRLNSIF